VRSLSTLLLITALAACGAPGSDSVFTRNNPRFGRVDSASPKVVAQQQVPTIVTRVYAGYYHKSGDVSQFQPCGTTRLLEITASWETKRMLMERFRWNAIWEGAKLYAVFQGAIVDDSTRADSSKAGPAKQFYLVGIDSVRTWQRSDCNGMRIPS
jgi:hypothetical protein